MNGRDRVDRILSQDDSLPLDGTKPWWQSRAVWGGIVAAAAGIASLFGVDIDQAKATEIAVSLAPLIGGALAVYGRVRASKPIRRIEKKNPLASGHDRSRQ